MLRIILAGVLLAFAAFPARAGDWLRAESPNFVVYTDMDARAARRLSQRLETLDQVLRLYHGVDLEAPVRRKLPVYLLRRSAELHRIRPGVSASLRGFYASHLEDTYAVAVAGEDESPLLHEYVHHFMLHRYPFGYAAWLVEGYPEYFMTLRQNGDQLEVGRADLNRARWLLNERWLPYERVLSSRPNDLRSDEERVMFYAQAWGLTHWLLSDTARGRLLNDYVAAVGAGEDSVKAMTRITGLTPDQLSRTVKTYLMKSFPVRRLAAASIKERPVSVTPLPRAAADVLLPTLRIMNDNGVDAPDDKTDGPVLLAAIRRAAEPHRGERLADLALARAELKLGDLALAERLLQARIDADPRDHEALQLMATARLRAATVANAQAAARLRREAREFAGRAHKINADHYPTLVVYAQAREWAADYPTENDLNVLLDALELAPQPGALRLKTAEALVRRGRTTQAARVLQPLAFDPHGGEAAAAARAVLAMLPPAPSTAAAATSGSQR